MKSKIIALIISFALMASAWSNVFAFDQKDFTNEELNEIVDMVVNSMIIYGRYESINKADLYKSGIKEVLKNHPEMYEDVLKGMLESIDENSEYYNQDEAAAFQEKISGTISGIGITFQMCKDGAEVMSVIHDTPAYEAGLQVGDVIVKADDHNLAGISSENVAAYIKGEVGTSVSISVKRKGEFNLLNFDLIRAEIIGTSVESAEFEEDGKKVLYIAIYGFVTNTAESFKKEIEYAKANGIDNLIIDLRNNGGGIFEQAINMVDCMVPQGSKITTEDHKVTGFNHTYYSETPDNQKKKFNTVILMNENTASASEVFTAGLYENGCAYLIGSNTYGKGTIQTVNELPLGDCMKYTVGYYLTPKGNNIHKVGIKPDMAVDNELNPYDMSGYTEYKYDRVYDIGDSGKEVEMSKKLLKDWGSFDGEINEAFDDDLAKAVYKFQEQTGLFPYGVLDFTTQHELYNRMALSKTETDNQLKEALKYFGINNIE